jgi:hypothetical protein
MPEADAFDEDQEQISRELSEWLPRRGDKLIHQETPFAAHVDPLGYSDLLNPEKRSPIGRRGLYSDGFLQAGDRLVDSLKGSPVEDALIYPIVYVYRHHLELELKGRILYCLNWLSGKNAEEIKSFASEKLNRNHRLLPLWHTLRNLYPCCAKQMPNETKAFEKLLAELDKLDPDGQAARYAEDIKEKQTFFGLYSLDLALFRSAIHKMSHYLDCILESIGEELDWRSEMASW